MNPRGSGSPATVAVTVILRTLRPRPLTLARPAASGKNSAEHAFRKRLNGNGREVSGQPWVPRWPRRWRPLGAPGLWTGLRVPASDLRNVLGHLPQPLHASVG